MSQLVQLGPWVFKSGSIEPMKCCTSFNQATTFHERWCGTTLALNHKMGTCHQIQIVLLQQMHHIITTLSTGTTSVLASFNGNRGLIDPSEIYSVVLNNKKFIGSIGPSWIVAVGRESFPSRINKSSTRKLLFENALCRLNRCQVYVRNLIFILIEIKWYILRITRKLALNLF